MKYFCIIFIMLIPLLYIYFKIITSLDYKENVEYNCDENSTEKWGGYCITKQRPNIGYNYILDVGLARAVGVVFKNKTIIDLGAGLGQYCELIRKYTSCDAYDGSKNIEIVTKGKVKYLNLAKRI